MQLAKRLSMVFALFTACGVQAQVPGDAMRLGTKGASQFEAAYDVMYSPSMNKNGELVTVRVFGTYDKADDFGIRSILSEVQFDCKANQFGFAKITGFEGPNLAGKNQEFPAEMLKEFQNMPVDKADPAMTVGVLPFTMVGQLKGIVCGGSGSPPSQSNTIAAATPSTSSTTQRPALSANNENKTSQLCTVGVKSKFLWPQDKQWYAGKVIDVRPDACRVRYDGYGAEDDAWVAPENMRLLVRWKDGKQYPATVVRKQGSNKYLVKYEGYGDSDNEVVDLSQLSIRPYN